MVGAQVRPAGISVASALDTLRASLHWIHFAAAVAPFNHAASPASFAVDPLPIKPQQADLRSRQGAPSVFATATTPMASPATSAVTPTAAMAATADRAPNHAAGTPDTRPSNPATATPAVPPDAAAPAEPSAHSIAAPVPARAVPSVVIPAVIAASPNELNSLDRIETVDHCAKCPGRSWHSSGTPADNSGRGNQRCGGDELHSKYSHGFSRGAVMISTVKLRRQNARRQAWFRADQVAAPQPAGAFIPAPIHCGRNRSQQAGATGAMPLQPASRSRRSAVRFVSL